MRLGVAWVPSSNAHYRAIEPMKAMIRRGHEVVWPADANGEVDPRRLANCDVVHVYRRADDHTRRVLMHLAGQGVGITFDNDDDLRAIPKESPDYKKFGGLTAQRLWTASVKAAHLADVFTTTNDALAKIYAAAGVAPVEVIRNCLAPDVRPPRKPHEGIVIGWVAGIDHRADVARVQIVPALERLLATHRDVRVESIGVDLGLSERYRHDGHVPFLELPGRIGGFDVGIAPLADIPCNRARSDIKLKEYAASGVPWLASPIGPYVGLGEEQGGRLVPDDGWLQALDRLVTHEREREHLAQKAAPWARGQTIEAAADHWERVFATAAGPQAAGTIPSRAAAARHFTTTQLKPGVVVRVRSRPGRGH